MRPFVRLVFALIVVALAPASFAEEPQATAHDCVVQGPIEGKWRSGTGNSTMTLEIRADGAFIAVANNWPVGPLRKDSGTATGKWRAIDGRFTGSISDSELKTYGIGYAWDDEIVLVNARYLILRNSSGGFEGYVHAE